MFSDDVSQNHGIYESKAKTLKLANVNIYGKNALFLKRAPSMFSYSCLLIFRHISRWQLDYIDNIISY